MAKEPDNPVLEHLRATRAGMAKMADCMQTLSVEMTAIRQQLAGVVTLRNHHHGDIAAIEHQLDGIKWRLEPAE